MVSTRDFNKGVNGMVTAEVGDDVSISDCSLPAEGDAATGEDIVLFMVLDGPLLNGAQVSLVRRMRIQKAPTQQVASPTAPSPSLQS
jgi:hypothetical protein